MQKGSPCIMQSICILGDSIAKGVVYDSQKNRYTISKESFGNRIAQELGCSVKIYPSSAVL